MESTDWGADPAKHQMQDQHRQKQIPETLDSGPGATIPKKGMTNGDHIRDEINTPG